MRTITTIGIVLSLAACGIEPGDSTTGEVAQDPGQPGTPSDPDTGNPPNAPDSPVGGPSVTAGVGPYFTNTMFWNTDVSTTAKSASSDKIIAALNAAGGWGNSNRFQIDFSLDVLTANATTPKRTFTPTDDFFSPDCDHVALPGRPAATSRTSRATRAPAMATATCSWSIPARRSCTRCGAPTSRRRSRAAAWRCGI